MNPQHLAQKQDLVRVFPLILYLDYPFIVVFFQGFCELGSDIISMI